jgi:hypothetical protein
MARLIGDTEITLPFPEGLRGKKTLFATEFFGPVNGVSRRLVTYMRTQGVNVAVVAPEISTNSSTPALSTTTTYYSDIEVRLKGYPLPFNPKFLSYIPSGSLLFTHERLGHHQISFISPIQQVSVPDPPADSSTEKTRCGTLEHPDQAVGCCEILFPAPLDAWAV